MTVDRSQRPPFIGFFEIMSRHWSICNSKKPSGSDSSKDTNHKSPEHTDEIWTLTIEQSVWPHEVLRWSADNQTPTFTRNAPNISKCTFCLYCIQNTQRQHQSVGSSSGALERSACGCCQNSPGVMEVPDCTTALYLFKKAEVNLKEQGCLYCSIQGYWIAYMIKWQGGWIE